MKLNIWKTLYAIIEMSLFVGACVFVTNEYIKGYDILSMSFGLFMLWIFIDKVSRPIRIVNQSGTKK